MEQKYKVNAENTKKYQDNIRKTVESMIRKQSDENREDGLDGRLYKRITKVNHTEQQIADFSEVMRTACEQSFKTTKAPRISQKYKSVPWWTQELIVMRKTTNYLRRKYQRTGEGRTKREK
jgi:phage gpG-like protein